MTSLYANPIQTREQGSTQTRNAAVSVDSILMFLSAMAPLLQHYKGVFVNPSLAITSFIAIIALRRISMGKVRINIGYLGLLLYGIYAAFIHGVDLTYLLREMVQVVVYLAVFNGMFDIGKLLRYARMIAVCATVMIILQYICYYILGFHLQLVAIPLLSSSTAQWHGLIRTGLIGVTGVRLHFYRPSAFFLEPSHFAIFCTPSIVTTLFSRTGDEKRERQLALFISLGVLLSTSGMGIGVVVLCWGIYLAFFYGQKGQARTIQLRKLLTRRTITLMILFLVALVGLYFGVPVFRQSVRRIFVTSGTMTAIEGRTTTGRRSLRMLTGIRKFIGFGDIYDISNWNMAAFFFVTFRFGWIGTAIFYSFYIYSLFHLKREAQMMTLIFLLLSFFTVHMFGAYYKMFYTMIILYGYTQNRWEQTGSGPDPVETPAARSSSAY